MSGFLQDVRHALRLLARAPGFVAVVVATVAIGIGANTAIFSVVRGVLLRPLPYPQSDRLLRIFNHWKILPKASVSVPELFDYRAQLTQIEGVSAYNWASGNLSGDGPPERVAMGRATSSLFPLLGVNPILGRRFTADEDQEGHEQVALLTHGFWQRRFGADPRAVGRTLRIDGLPYIVVGVLPSAFELGRSVDLWT